MSEQSIEENNVSLLREAYRLWNSADEKAVEYWLSIIADEVLWRSVADENPGLAFAKPMRSKTEVHAYLEGLIKEWEVVSHVVHDFIAHGDRIVAVGNCTWRHQATDNVVSSPKADVIRMQNGKIVEFFEFYDTAMAASGSQ